MKRITSIDVLRGQVMVLMALDHARLFFLSGSFFRDPLNPLTTTPLIFFTRWMTHFCAPVFVFLAGLSAYLYRQKRGSRGKTSLYLLIRGSVLILLELTVVRFAWTFDISGSFLLLQVIWAIGIAMIFLALFLYLPDIVVLAIGLLIIVSHNLMNISSAQPGVLSFVVKAALNGGYTIDASGKMIDFTYPFLPWIGVMFAGYGCGFLFKADFSRERRSRILLITGLISIVLFLLLRTIKLYGDPSVWTGSLYSFLDTEKYPPSLQFLLMTLGPSLVFLSLMEGKENLYTKILIVYGKVPLFFYMGHLYLIHFLALAILWVRGEEWTRMILTAQTFQLASLRNYGYGPAVVYAVWISVVVALYPICLWYGQKGRPGISRPFRSA